MYIYLGNVYFYIFTPVICTSCQECETVSNCHCIICLVYQILFLQSCVNLSIAIYIVELVNKFDDAFGDCRDCVHHTLTCKMFMSNLLH